jgi:hypothetical protein
MNTTTNGGGIACGKFDENRQSTVWMANQRRAGINSPYMRISEVYLGLAEAALMKATPDQTTADDMYKKTHERAGLAPKSGVTLEDIVDERGFEFAAEGDRRWNLIRTGFIGKKVKKIRELTKAMIEGLEANGYYAFDNGNEISNVIYYKAVAPGKVGLTSRLIDATEESMRVGGYEPASDAEAVKFPGWRGQHDWHNDGISGGKKVSYYGKTINDGNSNLCIKGLFKHLNAAPDGYKSFDWGKQIVSMKDFYLDGIFDGWDCKSAPIYLFPHTPNALLGGLTNGYGFSSSF